MEENQDTTSVTSTTNSSNESDEPSYDYYDVSDRAEVFMTDTPKLIALVLGVLALTANTISLIVVARALRRAKRQAAHFGFMISLAASDMLFALSVMMFIINKVLNPLYYPGYGPKTPRLYSRCFYIVIKALNTTALNAELLSLMGMAIDHYIAILRPLHYASLLHKKSYIIIIIVFWSIAVVGGFSDFIYVIHDLGDWKIYKNKFNLCEFVFLSRYQEEYPTFAIAALCLFTMVFSYARIYMVVCTHHNTNLNRSKKALATTLLIVGTFLLSWLPMCLFQIIMIIQVRVNPKNVEKLAMVLLKADQHIYNILLLNTLFDPVIYAVRIPELRMGYMRLIAEMCPCKTALSTSLRRGAVRGSSTSYTEGTRFSSTRSTFFRMSVKSNEPSESNRRIRGSNSSSRSQNKTCDVPILNTLDPTTEV